MGQFYDKVRERFIRYARINTQSANGVQDTPTTRRQFDLAEMLAEELREIGVPDVFLDEEHCVVYGSIPSNTGSVVPVGYIAHMDVPESVRAAYLALSADYPVRGADPRFASGK